MGNNKTIGMILIIIGILFIVMGIWVGMPKTTKTPSIYNEQNGTNTQVNDVRDSIYNENVNVYDEQESTRYIY